MNNYLYKALRELKKVKKKRVRKIPNAIRWGIIGTGYMSEVFSNTIDGNANGIVSGVASRTIDKANAFATRHGGCKAYGNYSDLATDPEIDIIYIATPIAQHYENIKMCLAANKNVLCEKPIVTTFEELQELRILAEERGVFLAEGMWMKCLPTYQKAQEWLAEGKIGTLELIKVDFYKKEIVDLSKSTYQKESGGGVLRDYGIYAISFPFGFFNSQAEVIFSAHNMSFNVDSDWMINLSSGDVQAFINISSDFNGSSRAALIGSEGSIEWNSQFNRTNTIILYDKYRNKVDQFVAKYEFEGFEYEVNEVQECIRNHSQISSKLSIKQSENTIKLINQLLTLNYNTYEERFRIKQ